MREKNSSQYCPYLQASFHARAIPRTCRIPETHMQGHSPSHGSSSSTLSGGTILKREFARRNARGLEKRAGARVFQTVWWRRKTEGSRATIPQLASGSVARRSEKSQAHWWCRSMHFMLMRTHEGRWWHVHEPRVQGTSACRLPFLLFRRLSFPFFLLCCLPPSPRALRSVAMTFGEVHADGEMCCLGASLYLQRFCLIADLHA